MNIDYKNFTRDPISGGVVNNDPAAYSNYKKKREAALQKLKSEKIIEERIQSNENDINKIKSDVSEIKDLLKSLMSKLT